MRVEQVQISERPLIDAYRHDFEHVQEFFSYDPGRWESFHQRYQTLLGKEFHRGAVVDALMNYNRQIGATTQTLANIQRLADERTVAVLTGQQAGVLTGPLYTIYKALTIVQLANRLTGDGIPAVPIFWIASEDHDFYEIAGVYFLNREHEEVEVRLRGEVDRQPIGRLQMRTEVEQLIAEFAAQTPDTDFKAEQIAQLQTLAAESENLAEWFARVMAWLFADSGLIFVDSLDPALRRLGTDFFLQVLEHNEAITERLQAAEVRLAGKGFPAQIKTTADQVHLFFIEDDARYPLEKRTHDYLLRGRDSLYTDEAIKARITAASETVSTNVVTRPLLQDILFPTIAYVGGPGEIAYYAQYREVYPLFGMEMPVIYPRVSLTLVERTIAKGLQKYNLTMLEIHQHYAEIRENFLQNADMLNLQERFQRFKGSFIPQHQQLVKDLQRLDPKFKQLGAQNLERILEEISYLEEKAHHQHRKNSEDLLQSLSKLKMNLSPGDHFQERRLNIFPYLFKYQIRLIKELMELDLLQSNDHHLIYL